MRWWCRDAEHRDMDFVIRIDDNSVHSSHSHSMRSQTTKTRHKFSRIPKQINRVKGLHTGDFVGFRFRFRFLLSLRALRFFCCWFWWVSVLCCARRFYSIWVLLLFFVQLWRLMLYVFVLHTICLGKNLSARDEKNESRTKNPHTTQFMDVLHGANGYRETFVYNTQ